MVEQVLQTLELGDDIGEGHGEPTLYHGRVTDTFGQPIAHCELDVWSGDDEGFYDMQKGDEMQLRAQFRTDAQGNYRFWSIKPTFYPVPGDGPVGAMLDKMGRHLNRPGHMHMMLIHRQDADIARRQLVLDLGNGELIAGDYATGEDHRVAPVQLDIGMAAGGDTRQRVLHARSSVRWLC